MPRTGAKNVKVTFNAGQLTHFGGVYLLHRFLQQIRLRSFLCTRLQINERNNYFTITERLLALIYPMLLGLNSLELMVLLGNNGVFQYLTGLPRVPRPNTLRRFLIDKADVLSPRLKPVHNILRAHFLVGHSSYWLDFDSTVKTLYGHQEGVVKGYNPEHKGKKSYHPLICTEAHFQDCLGGELRYGDAGNTDGVSQMLTSVLEIIPSTTQNVRFRADAGFYDGDFVAKLSRNNCKFALVAIRTRPLQVKILGQKYTFANQTQATAEFQYQPLDWDQPYRFVALREKLTEERKQQLQLFTMEKYSYRLLVTNLNLTPIGVFRFYDGRAGLERIVRILKEDYPFARALTNNFAANSLYAELSLLAYNIIIWFKRLCLPDDWQSYTISTLRHRLLLIPGVFTRTGNRPMLKLPKNCLYQDVFASALKKINNLSSLVE
jgi:hypothetical protein